MTKLGRASGSLFVTILLLAGLFVLAVWLLVAGTVPARSLALQEQGLSAPYVSEPVAPADTRGMPPAGPPESLGSGEQAEDHGLNEVHEP